jgi:hypothetical protein
MTVPREAILRFHDSYIAVPEAGCWLWTKTVNHYGYGKRWKGTPASGA